MRWKYDKEWGQAQIETIREFPGEVGMISNKNRQDSKQVLGRLEAHQAERVLGVRLPLDGNMKSEFLHRCKQIRSFSKKVFNAPISHWDAWVIYESRYRAMIRYPLPVTLFSDSQCMKIQRPFVDAILPKMGINRKTPRCIIYGPRTMGGLEMMDVRVEQVSAIFEITKGHMRRLDRAGKGLYLTAHNMQVILGRSEPFYNLDPDRNDYTADNTRWKYIWTQVHRLDLNMKIYNFWTPKLRCKNDRNIMDVAAEDKIVKQSKWKLLQHINQCRLYVRAFTIEELSLDGVTIHEPYLTGKERGVREDSIVLPDVRRPTDNQWRLWKSFIFRNFLSPGTRINPPLGSYSSEIDEQLLLPISETDQMISAPSEGLSILEMVAQLPSNLKVMMGTVIIPNDDGLAISEAIVDGRCVGASDGSLIKDFRSQRGSHGYALQVMGSDIPNIEGYGVSPDCDRMSSLTTEHYGLIGLLVTLHLISIKYKLCREECFDQVVILVDNKTVVERGNKKQEIINLSDYAAPDQDLWMLTTELIEKLTISIELKWIRGHQDSNEFGERIYGPFSQEVQMNLLVDELATKGMRLDRPIPTIRPNLHNAVLSVYDEKGVAILNMRDYMTEKINGGRMLEYLLRKRKWDNTILQMIEWEGIEGMMKQANPMKRIQLLKMLHGWQNIGTQKGKIRDSRLKLDSDQPLEPTIDEVNCHLCPSGCGESEVELHFLNCPVPSKVKERENSIRTVLKKLQTLKTYEGIISLVRLILTNVSRREDLEVHSKEFLEDGLLSMTNTIGQQKNNRVAGVLPGLLS